MKASPAAFLAGLYALAFLAGCSDGSSAQLTGEPQTTEPLASEPGTELHAEAPAAVDEPAASAPQHDAAAGRSAAAHALPDFAPLVARHGAAVVNVEVVQRLQGSAGEMPDDPLLEFFRRFGLPMPEGHPHGNVPLRGSGSGFIVTPNGYILTNAHVVAQAEEVTVRLTDRREFPARVIGTDPYTDIAVIKIDAQQLPTVRVGDPRALKPGEWVLAIGSPFGLDNSATAGIVSATARAIGGDGYVPFIQTDVAVNPGNSGGPLFNLAGEVVGVNSMIFSRTGGYMGLSFAIPIDVATEIREQLIRTGRVVRGRIGVAVQDVNAQLAESFGLDRPHGALISAVENDSPAAKAGLKPGDVILAVDGHDIDRFGDLSARISRMKPGSEAQLNVWREGRERTIDVGVSRLEVPAERRVTSKSGSSDEATRLGLAVRDLSEEERRRAATDGVVLVEAVSGAAALAGVQPGDIVLGINGKRIESVQQLRGAVKAGQQTIALLIERGDAQIFIPVRVG